MELLIDLVKKYVIRGEIIYRNIILNCNDLFIKNNSNYVIYYE